MKLHFINVGYGDAILLESEGWNLLIDGGRPAGTEYDKPPRVRAVDYLRQIGVTTIDVMVVTHLHTDHLGGLAEVAREMPVRELWCALPPLGSLPLEPGGMESEGALNALNSLNLSDEIYRHVAEQGRVRRIGAEQAPIFQNAELSVECLWPDRETAERQDALIREIRQTNDPLPRCKLLEQLFAFANRCSVVLRVVCGEAVALLAADVDAETLEQLADRPGGIGANLLKLPHHGRTGSMTERAARAIGPEIAVVSVSNDCGGGCPSEATLGCFGDKIRLFFTDGVDLPGRKAEAISSLIFQVKRESSSRFSLL